MSEDIHSAAFDAPPYHLWDSQIFDVIMEQCDAAHAFETRRPEIYCLVEC